MLTQGDILVGVDYSCVHRRPLTEILEILAQKDKFTLLFLRDCDHHDAPLKSKVVSEAHEKEPSSLHPRSPRQWAEALEAPVKHGLDWALAQGSTARFLTCFENRNFSPRYVV